MTAGDVAVSPRLHRADILPALRAPLSSDLVLGPLPAAVHAQASCTRIVAAATPDTASAALRAFRLLQWAALPLCPRGDCLCVPASGALLAQVLHERQDAGPGASFCLVVLHAACRQRQRSTCALPRQVTASMPSIADHLLPAAVLQYLAGFRPDFLPVARSVQDFSQVCIDILISPSLTSNACGTCAPTSAIPTALVVPRTHVPHLRCGRVRTRRRGRQVQQLRKFKIIGCSTAYLTFWPGRAERVSMWRAKREGLDADLLVSQWLPKTADSADP